MCYELYMHLSHIVPDKAPNIEVNIFVQLFKTVRLLIRYHIPKYTHLHRAATGRVFCHGTEANRTGTATVRAQRHDARTHSDAVDEDVWVPSRGASANPNRNIHTIPIALCCQGMGSAAPWMGIEIRFGECVCSSVGLAAGVQLWAASMPSVFACLSAVAPCSLLVSPDIQAPANRAPSYMQPCA